MELFAYQLSLLSSNSSGNMGIFNYPVEDNYSPIRNMVHKGGPCVLWGSRSKADCFPASSAPPPHHLDSLCVIPGSLAKGFQKAKGRCEDVQNEDSVECKSCSIMISQLLWFCLNIGLLSVLEEMMLYKCQLYHGMFLSQTNLIYGSTKSFHKYFVLGTE